VADARTKAEAAASGANARLGRIIRVEEQGVVSRPPMPYMAVREASAQAADAPVISAGQLELRANVTLTAELQ